VAVINIKTNKIRLLAVSFFLLLLPVCSCEHPGGGGRNPEETPDEATGPIVRIASFNIRLATDSDTGVRAWSARKEACTQVVQRYAFGVWGLQEVLSIQQTDLKALLPQYDFYFVGRDDGTAGEAVGIAWLRSKYECLDKGHFWLSSTPDVPSGSESWGGMARHRVAAWARFRDMSTGINFYFFSTHLEVGEDYTDIRLRSAELIVARENQLNISGLPVFIVGDMNPIAPTEKAMRKFRETYIDSWQQADMDRVREGPVGSFNGFNPDVNLETQSRRGDYIFYKGDVKLDRYKCIDDKFDGQYPSDHLPVMVDVQLVERADDE